MPHHPAEALSPDRRGSLLRALLSGTLVPVALSVKARNPRRANCGGLPPLRATNRRACNGRPW